MSKLQPYIHGDFSRIRADAMSLCERGQNLRGSVFAVCENLKISLVVHSWEEKGLIQETSGEGLCKKHVSWKEISSSSVLIVSI